MSMRCNSPSQVKPRSGAAAQTAPVWKPVQQWTGVGGGQGGGGTEGGSKMERASDSGDCEPLVPVSVWIMVQGSNEAHSSVWKEDGVVQW